MEENNFFDSCFRHLPMTANKVSQVEVANRAPGKTPELNMNPPADSRNSHFFTMNAFCMERWKCIACFQSHILGTFVLN
jgi:hypothetical protein